MAAEAGIVRILFIARGQAHFLVLILLVMTDPADPLRRAAEFCM